MHEEFAACGHFDAGKPTDSLKLDSISRVQLNAIESTQTYTYAVVKRRACLFTIILNKISVGVTVTANFLYVGLRLTGKGLR